MYSISWSKSGQLLASGSDDQHVNIHQYLPEDSLHQFRHTTTIATGHSANIFSVKFMPGSDDRTVVTAAGDSEVRIFDIEYSGRSTAAGARAGSFVPVGGRRRPFTVVEGVRYLSEGDTNCKVYRSHSDRVKRIVTESSPFFFLTCSEDGEVRQWDIRAPESAYPASPSWRSLRNEDDTNVPPPLISYKRYNLDLNTISCSANQPHYIALGGAHLHCFLHDRRMLGRDRLAERGARLSSVASWSDGDEEIMAQATQCVRKFEPKGRQKMKRNESGHITACKISDANPNEMIVSWSGDHIYSFDLVKSPAAGEDRPKSTAIPSKSRKVKESSERKRKRVTKTASSLSLDSIHRAGSRQRTGSAPSQAEAGDDMAIRVRYQNGQTEEIPLQTPQRSSPEIPELEDILTDEQQQAHHVASAVVHLRRGMFTLPIPEARTPENLTGQKKAFTGVVHKALDILPKMDQISRSWTYKVDPTPVEIAQAKKLRRDRNSARRFVQATAVLARICSGEMPPDLAREQYVYLTRIQPAPNEQSAESTIPKNQHFGYDFLKAIILWLDSGIGSLVDGFSSKSRRQESRLPIPNGSSSEAVHDFLIPYLSELASDKPIIDVDANRFEIDENRVIFPSEKAALKAFSKALKRPFSDLSSESHESPAGDHSKSGSTSQTDLDFQSRATALRFWAYKVGRGVLMNAGEGVNFQFVDFAYGGLGRVGRAIRNMEERLNLQQEDVDLEMDEGPIVEDFEIIRASGSTSQSASAAMANSSQQEPSNESATSADVPTHTARGAPEDEDDENLPERLTVSLGDGEYLMLENGMSEETSVQDEDEDDGDGDELGSGSDSESEEEDDDEDDDDEEDPDGPANPRINPIQFINRHNLSIRASRSKANSTVPCSSATRTYKGHANVKTVKDVNFFGLDDEYVVSGSDDGNLFIWDRKTTRLVNILEGDGEVVNVLQPHPYETMIAVSGIDSTVKIFSPDGRARRSARLGLGVKRADEREFSSIETYLGRRASRRTTSEQQREEEAAARDEEDDQFVAEDGLESRKRMQDEYQILGRNDMARRGGGEGYITVSVRDHFYFLPLH